MYGQPMKKPLIVVIVALLAFGFYGLNLNHYLTLDSLKVSLGQFEDLRKASPIFV